MLKNIGYLENGKYYGGKHVSGIIYKNFDSLINEDEVAYIPSAVFEDISDGLTKEEIEQNGGVAYTFNDLIKLCNGNRSSAIFVLTNIDWIHPETFIEQLSLADYEMCDKCGVIYDLEKMDKCPHCI